jgi:hypothetical protein
MKNLTKKLFSNSAKNTDSKKLTSLAFPIKKLAIVSLSTIMAGTTLFASAEDYQQAQRELKIMSKIFDTSLSEAKMSNTSRMFSSRSSGPQATYLAKQGMVFTFDFARSEFGNADDWQAFGEGVGRLVGSIASEVSEAFAEIDSEFSEVPRAPRSPRASRSNDHDDAWEEKMEAYDAYRAAMEELRESQRESRREIRDMQRTIRELEREAKHNKGESAELNKQRQALEIKMQKLSEEQALYKKTMEEYSEKQTQKIREKNTKKSNLIISTLCDYGPTLRSLKDGEHVTLIFTNYENSKDQVHVFEFDDVSDCTSKDKLVKSGVSYQL